MLKSLYISAYISSSIAGLVYALWRIAGEGWGSPWTGAALACAGPVVFFATVFTLPIARTSPDLRLVLAAGVAGTVVSVVLAGGTWTAAVVAAIVGIAGHAGYVRWYSRFGAPSNDALAPGRRLPDFPLVERGRELRSAGLTAKPALWIFYRGNWCPSASRRSERSATSTARSPGTASRCSS